MRANNELLLFEQEEIKPSEEVKNIKPSFYFTKKVIKKFLKPSISIPWGRECKLAQKLFTQYTPEQLLGLNLGFDLNSLSFFFTEAGKRILRDKFSPKENVKLDMVKKIDYDIQGKIGDNLILDKPKSIRDFID